jgi:hypothetical protein
MWLEAWRRLLTDAENVCGEVPFDHLMGARNEERYHAANGRSGI